MVQALLAGRKTQTRRIVKPQPIDDTVNSGYVFSGDHLHLYKNDILHQPWKERFVELCPYEVGDVLWVRETWCKFVDEHIIDSKYAYRANVNGGDPEGERCRQDYIKAGYPYQWKSSMYMPYEACRIWLELIHIRIEQLQDITEDDAKAEGAVCTVKTLHPIKQYDDLFPSARQHYHEIWEGIHGKASWDENPYVWVYDFKRVDKPAKSGQ